MLLLVALLMGFTLNAEVLERYGYTLDGYNAMSPSEQRRVEDFIRAKEDERQAAFRRHAEPKVATAAEDVPTLKRLASEPSAWSAEARLANGELSKYSLHNSRHGFTLELGDLGAGGQSSMLRSSKYLNLRKEAAGSGKALDHEYKIQAALVDVNAALHPDDNPAVDRRLNESLSLMRQDPSAFSYSTDAQSQRMEVFSAWGRVGRGYRLFGPVDAAWSASGLATITGRIPNLALDQSAGLRIRASDTQTVGLFGGLTEAAGFVAKDIVSRSVGGEKVPLKPELDTAPHATAAAWGRMPYLSNVNYSLEAGREWRPWTTVQSVAASVSGERLGVEGRYKVESGAALEFERRQAQATLSYRASGGVDLWATASRDHGKLGEAALQNDSVLLGLTVRETVKEGASASVSALFTEGDKMLVPPASANALAKLLDEQLQRALAYKRAIETLAGGSAGEGWAAAQELWRQLDPAVRDQLNAASGGRLATLMSTPAARVEELSRLATLIADVEVLDRAVVRALRSAVAKELEKTEIPVLGGKARLTAPNLLALAHAYSLGLRPLPGVTTADRRNALDPWLSGKLKEFGECGAAKLSDCLLGKLPSAEAEQLRRDYGAQLEMTLQEAVAWNSDIIARELNAMMLRIIMTASRAFDQLTVNAGASASEMNRRALLTSFALLDERDRKTAGRVLRRAAEREEAELRERDRALAERLTRYGQQRLAWLQAQPAWPAGVQVTVKPEHWAPLLAAYGDDRLFDVVLQAKTKGKRVLIELSENDPLNALWVVPGDPLVIRLPPRPPKGGLSLP